MRQRDQQPDRQPQAGQPIPAELDDELRRFLGDSVEQWRDRYAPAVRPDEPTAVG